jgi:hypothetical protein
MTTEENINNLSENEAKDMLANIIKTTYFLVEWPTSQDYMEEEWFDNEAILALGSEEITGSSAYFIPTHYIIK